MEKQRWVLFLHVFFLNANFKSCVSTTNSSFRLSPIDQQELDRVNPLPGQYFNVDFEHYSGYVAVNEDAGRNLFYWFIEATEDPSSKPLILWINGVANLLFIDTPVGTGYSYSEDSEDVINNGDARTANDNLVFLQKWLERFPQYKGSDFYIIGHYVPQLAKAIVKFHESIGEKSINLKGIMVGNDLTDDHDNHLGSFQFLWTNGLISDETYNLVNNFCLFESYQNISSHCRFIFDLVNKELGNIDPYSIFTPSSTGTTSQSSRLLNRLIYGGICEEFDPCIEDHTSVYFNLPEVQRALHADPADMTSASEDLLTTTWKDSPASVLDIYHDLMHLGLRIWMINTDSVTPVTSTRYSINSLKLPSVGGWTQEYKGLTFVSVRGAGHDISMYKPSLAYPVIKACLSGIAMPTQSSQLADS
ncbi:hypothetical protein MKX01_009486 [Papaver californicum]|nr:hypothetical protein MKX01_009486 [Papaver californicum]